MRKYTVTISYRPNANSLMRTRTALTVSARSRETALLEAGYRIGAKGGSMVSSSVQIEGVVRV